MTDAYNYGMVGVGGGGGMEDQLCLNYRVEHWMRLRKLWWSILLWDLGVVAKKSYVIYLKTCEQESQNKKGDL